MDRKVYVKGRRLKKITPMYLHVVFYITSIYCSKIDCNVIVI
jgi:hypothetical protein